MGGEELREIKKLKCHDGRKKGGAASIEGSATAEKGKKKKKEVEM